MMYVNLKTIIVLGICSFAFAADEGTDKNSQCLNDLLQWCGEMKKSPNFIGNFMTSDYSSSGERRTIHCMSGRGGTNCTLNNNPWFGCRPDGSVTYKNNVLQENSTISDDGICDAARKATNMFNYDSAEVEAAMKAGKEVYDKAMNNMRNTMDNLHRTLSRPCFPFCNGNPFGNGFPFYG